MAHETRALNDIGKHAVVIFDDQGRILAANRQFCELTQYAKEALIGRPDPSLYSPSEPSLSAVPDFWSKVIGGYPEIGQFKRFDANGTELWVTGRYTKRDAQDGCAAGVTLIARDVTKNVVNQF